MMKAFTRYHRRVAKRGSVVVLVALLTVVFLIFVAFGVDFGYILMVRNEMQNAADSAALAAAAQLVDEARDGQFDDMIDARTFAVAFAGDNSSTGDTRTLDRNDGNAANGDVVIGRLDDPDDLSETLILAPSEPCNSVQVNLRRLSSQNNPIGLFFAKAVGIGSTEMNVTATATADDRVGGFTLPSGPPADGAPGDMTLELMPFALFYDDFWAEMANPTLDEVKWDDTTNEFVPGTDGFPEISMYPHTIKDLSGSYDNPAGNFGTIDIGNHNNSAADITRQILYGITAEEMATVDGLAFQMHSDDNGDGMPEYYKEVDGDTGVSTSIGKALKEIIGLPRFLPLYRAVHDPGDNATYELVSFIPMRIIKVVMTGPLEDRHVEMQPFFGTTSHGMILPGVPPPPGGGPGLLYALYLTR